MDHFHILLSLQKEPATLITSLLSDDTTELVSNKMTNVYQKENIKSIINLRRISHNFSCHSTDNLQENMNFLEELLLGLSSLKEPVSRPAL